MSVLPVAHNATPDLWRALANPLRRSLLDTLRQGPATTSELARAHPELSRFGVMQHLDVLVEANLVLVERRGRERYNYLNAVPLREWYERWVTPFADSGAEALLALRKVVLTQTPKGSSMQSAESPEHARVVRLEYELPIAASADRVFEVLTQRTLEWSPYSYGEDRTRAIVVEPFVGGRHYEDWGDGAGHLYGWVSEWDAPRSWSTRGRLAAGTTLDSEYTITDTPDGVIVHVTKVAVGSLTDDEAAGIRTHGDLRDRAANIQRLAQQ
jgi:DNA-binding transcriptional ArsR family regulator